MTEETLEPVQVGCPFCRYTEIIYLPREELPKCPQCGAQMVIEQVLDKGEPH